MSLTNVTSDLYSNPHSNFWNKTTSNTIVIDLDLTMIHTFETMEGFARVADSPRLIRSRDRIYYFNSGETDEYWGIARPHFREFLMFCFNYFTNVIIWSAGTYHYVHAIVRFLFRDLPYKPALVLTRDDCIIEDIDGTKCYTKPLIELAKHGFKQSTQSNTYILDDNPIAFFNDFNNAINIPEYNPKPTIESVLAEDNAFDKIITWLKNPVVIKTKDIRELNKQKIFDEPPVEEDYSSLYE